MVEIGRHGIAAGDAGRLGERGLAGVLDEPAAVVLFEVVAVAAGHGQSPVAEGFALCVAFAAGPEQKAGGGVFARQRFGVGESFQRLVDGRVDALRLASEGGVEGASDGGADEVVVHGDGGLLLDEVLGVGLGNVDAFTGGAAEKRLFQFDKHDDSSRWVHGSKVRTRRRSTISGPRRLTAWRPSPSAIPDGWNGSNVTFVHLVSVAQFG